MSDSLFWPSCALRGETFAVIPLTETSANGGVSLVQLAVSSRQSFCLVRAADVLQFFNSLGQVKFIAQNAAELCGLMAASLPEGAIRRAMRRHFFEITLNCRLIDIRLLDSLVKLATEQSFQEEPPTAQEILGTYLPTPSEEPVQGSVGVKMNQLRLELAAMLSHWEQLEQGCDSIAQRTKADGAHPALLGLSFHVGSSLATNSPVPSLSLDHERLAAFVERWESDASRLGKLLAKGKLSGAYSIEDGHVRLKKQPFTRLIRESMFTSPEGRLVEPLTDDDDQVPIRPNYWTGLKLYNEDVANWIELDAVMHLLRLARSGESEVHCSGTQLPRFNPHWSWSVWEQLISLRLLRFSQVRAFVVDLPELKWRCFAECGLGGRGSDFFRGCYARSLRPAQVVREAIESRPDQFPPLVALRTDLEPLAEALLDCACLGIQKPDFQRRCKSLAINGVSASVVSGLFGLVGEIAKELGPTIVRHIGLAESKFRRRANAPWSPEIAGYIDLTDDLRKAVWLWLGADGFELLAVSPDKFLVAAPPDFTGGVEEVRAIISQATSRLIATPVEAAVTNYD